MLNRLLLIALLALALTACGGGGGSKEDSGSNTPGAPSSPTNPGDDGGSKTPEEEQYERDQETRETVAGMAASSLLLVLDHVDGYVTLVGPGVLGELKNVVGGPPSSGKVLVPEVCASGQAYLKAGSALPIRVEASFEGCAPYANPQLKITGEFTFTSLPGGDHIISVPPVGGLAAATFGIDHYGNQWKLFGEVTLSIRKDAQNRDHYDLIQPSITVEKSLGGGDMVLFEIGAGGGGGSVPLLTYHVNTAGRGEVEIPASPGVQVSVSNVEKGTLKGSEYVDYNTVASNGALTKLVLTERFEAECNGTPTNRMQVRTLSGSLQVIDEMRPERSYIYEVVGGDPQRFDVKKYDKDGNHTPVALAPGDDDQCNYLSRLAP